MKDNRIAEIVNDITAAAKEYAGSQQLRVRLGDKIKLALKEQDRDTRHACAEAVSDPSIGDRTMAHNACMNVKAV